MRALHTSAVAILLTLGAACGDTAEEAALAPAADLRSDDISAPPTPRYSGMCPFDETRAVVKSNADWQRIWAELVACVSPAPSAPTVDFDREMLLVAALGPRSSAGYFASIRNAVIDGGGVLRVSVVEYAPGERCVTAAVVTYPVAVARVPRVGARAEFERQVEVVDCD